MQPARNQGIPLDDVVLAVAQSTHAAVLHLAGHLGSRLHEQQRREALRGCLAHVHGALARLLRKVIAYVIEGGAQDDNAVAAAFLSEQLSSRWSPLYTPLGCGEWVAASCPKGSDPLFSDIAAAEIDLHAEKIAAAMREQLGKVDAADAGRMEAVRRLLLVRWVEMTARYVVAAQQEASLCHFMRCLAARWRRMAWSA